MGELLNDRYELGDVVGVGGMGAVHRALDTRLGRTVAVKVLRDGSLADHVARSRMRSEARLAGSIHHPGIANVFDVDTASTADGPSFIVMQFVEGQSLAQVLREHGAMPVGQVMSVVCQVADALAAAHAAGVVHRDLKPANIMLTPAGRTVLVDFGIAHSDTSEPLTDTGVLLGTADYLSPEQAAGRPASVQSDLYSLGVVAHHCLTGTSPFRRESQIATAVAHLHDELPPLAPSVPARARALIARLTEKSPFDRPASAAEVALEAAAAGASPSLDTSLTAALDVTSRDDTVTAGDAEPARFPRLLTGTSLVAAVALLLVLLGVGQSGSGAAGPIPDVVGMDAIDAASLIAADGLSMKRTMVDSIGTPAGEVVSQSPAAGGTRPDSDTVQVTVATGKISVPVDGIVGAPVAEATTALERLGFVVACDEVSSPSSVGQVLALDRSGRQPQGSTITLQIASAPPVAVTAPSAVSPVGSTAAPPASSTTGGKQAKTGKGKGKGKRQR